VTIRSAFREESGKSGLVGALKPGWNDRGHQ